MREGWRREERGSLMIDGMIAMLITIMILVFLMSVGFLLYQQWLVSNVANDTATRVAQSYAYPNTDPVMGYINTQLMDNVSIFRYIGNELNEGNTAKGEKFAAWSLRQSSLAAPVSPPEIQVIPHCDSLARQHVEVIITAEYEIPFGGVLPYFGMDPTVTYTATGEAVCIDLLDHINTIDTVKALTDNTFGSKVLGMFDSIGSMVKKLKDLFS